MLCMLIVLHTIAHTIPHYTKRPQFKYMPLIRELAYNYSHLLLCHMLCFQEDHTTLPPQYFVTSNFDPPWPKSWKKPCIEKVLIIYVIQHSNISSSWQALPLYNGCACMHTHTHFTTVHTYMNWQIQGFFWGEQRGHFASPLKWFCSPELCLNDKIDFNII